MKFGVAMFPSKELQDKVNQYRKRYDAHYALIPPHITIKDGFEADESEKENVAILVPIYFKVEKNERTPIPA